MTILPNKPTHIFIRGQISMTGQRTLHSRWLHCLLLALVPIAFSHATAGPFVPGTGTKITVVGDNFEDPSWKYVPNGSKASFEQDEQQRPPGGRSKNGRWYESALRGQPDVIKRITTPPGGLPGSQGALLLATRLSGIPGRPSGEQQQDDLLMGVKTRIGRPIPASWSPSFVVRVYLPPFEKWENRTGASFGIRGDVRGRDRRGEIAPYWPGMFVLFRSATSRRFDHDFAQISVRAGKNGRDVAGPIIEQPGWWTFGLSFTPDGAIHYYASEGVDELTEEDHLYSGSPYGSRCLWFDNFFVNVANWDNGKRWSTPWVIDDPVICVIPPAGQQLTNLVRQRTRRVARTAKTRPQSASTRTASQSSRQQQASHSIKQPKQVTQTARRH